MNEDEIIRFIEDQNNISSLLPENIVITEKLARGGQGIVYKGIANELPAAIKVYFPGQDVSRIKRETSTLFTLNNPNIVRPLWAEILSLGEVEFPIIATTFIEGDNLGDRLKAGKLNHSEIGIIAFDIANAIDAMWSTPDRIVHRDLKPPNVVMKLDGRACVIDLGVARHVNRTPLTTTGFTLGTDGYMSPEQLSGARNITSKSDVFALGVILIECAMGRHPSKYDQASLFSMKLHEKLPYEISSWNFADMVKDMLHPRATKRPTPKQMLDSFQEFSPR